LCFPSKDRPKRLVSRGQNLRLHQLHVFPVNFQITVTGLDDEKFNPRLFVFVALTKLYSHVVSPNYFLSSSGVSLQVNSPSPPLVTMNSELHVGHTYRLPVCAAMHFPLYLLVRGITGIH